MGDSFRIYAGFVILSALLTLIAVLGGRGGLGGSGEPLPPRSEVNRIVYVGLDLQIRAVLPDGSDPWQISPAGGLFTWPTWSPDARKLVFSGVNEVAPGDYRVSLFSGSPFEGETREIFVNELGIEYQLAEDVFHYPLWSPDGRQVAFIAFSSNGLTLFVDDLGDSKDATQVMDQGPMWISWSPDSRYLLVHRGGTHFLVNTLGGITVSELGIPSMGYRVPAWMPRENTVAIVAEQEPGEHMLMRAEVKGNGLEVPQPIIDVPRDPAFLWSPTGEYLALAGSSTLLDYLGMPLLAYREVVLLSEDGTRQPVQTDGDIILAFFWSPDGSKLAYVSLADRRGVLRWNVFSPGDGERAPLVDFIPSRHQLTMFQFFDQYYYSHPLWSPDSGSLVFSGRLVDGTTASLSSYSTAQQRTQIVVVEATSNATANEIADGILAFWSPR